jgi:hypothetical protein
MAVDWNAEAANEPEVRGKITKVERKPAPAPSAASDDLLKSGTAMLAEAARTARLSQEDKIAAVRKSLAPVVKEGLEAL